MSHSQHPRSASMPLMQQATGAVAAIETPDHNGEEPTVTAEEIANEAFRPTRDNFPQPAERRAASSHADSNNAGSNETPAIGASNSGGWFFVAYRYTADEF